MQRNCIWLVFSFLCFIEAERRDCTIYYWPLARCCAGYQARDFLFCDPVCEPVCGKFQDCVAPNECRCKNGYQEARTTTSGYLTCQPICINGCGEHAHCQAPNLCECDEQYRGKSTGDTLCQRRCRLGILWDPQTLECVEQQQVNITVIAPEIDILMPDLEDGAGDGSTEGFGILSSLNELETQMSNTRQNKFDWLKCINILIVVGVVSVLIATALAAGYLWQQHKCENAVMLEGTHDLRGEYVTERNQILVC